MFMNDNPYTSPVSATTLETKPSEPLLISGNALVTCCWSSGRGNGCWKCDRVAPSRHYTNRFEEIKDEN